MTRNRSAETDDQRRERMKRLARERHEAAAEEADAVDAMVRKSIKLYGP